MTRFIARIRGLIIGLAAVVIAVAALAFCACATENPAEPLDAPETLDIDDYDMLSWGEVDNAVGYTVYLDGDEYDAEGNSFDIFELAVEFKTYEIKVKAVGDGANYSNSEWSESIEYTVTDYFRNGEGEISTYVNDAESFAMTVSDKSVFSGKVVLPSNYNYTPIARIGENAFGGCSEITMLYIPENVKNIDAGAFTSCTSLKRVHLPLTLKEIGDTAFYQCSALEDIKLPAKILTLGNGCFADCSSLDNISIPMGIEVLPQQIFYNCTELSSVELTDGLLEIGTGVFMNCPKLTEVEIPQTVTTLDDLAFYKSGLKSIVIPQSVKTIGMAITGGCDNLENIAVDAKNRYFMADGNCLIQVSGNILVAGCKTSVIPNQIKTITGAFYEITGLTEIDIPESVTNIGDYSFYGCSALAEIEIKSTVVLIGNYAFGGCVSLKEVTIPASVRSVGSYAFGGCTELASLTFEVKDGWKATIVSMFGTNTVDLPSSFFDDPAVCAESLSSSSNWALASYAR